MEAASRSLANHEVRRRQGYLLIGVIEHSSSPVKWLIEWAAGVINKG